MLHREPDVQLAVADVDSDDRPLVELAGEQGATDPRLQLVGEVAPQRAGSVHRVVAMLGDEPACVLGEFECRAALGQAAAQLLDLQIDDLLDLRQGQAAEQDDVVDPVEELGPEVRPQLAP